MGRRILETRASGERIRGGEGIRAGWERIIGTWGEGIRAGERGSVLGRGDMTVV
jgi:hypothetical protein